MDLYKVKFLFCLLIFIWGATLNASLPKSIGSNTPTQQLSISAIEIKLKITNSLENRLGESLSEQDLKQLNKFSSMSEQLIDQRAHIASLIPNVNFEQVTPLFCLGIKIAGGVSANYRICSNIQGKLYTIGGAGLFSFGAIGVASAFIHIGPPENLLGHYNGASGGISSNLLKSISKWGAAGGELAFFKNTTRGYDSHLIAVGVTVGYILELSPEVLWITELSPSGPEAEHHYLTQFGELEYSKLEDEISSTIGATVTDSKISWEVWSWVHKLGSTDNYSLSVLVDGTTTVYCVLGLGWYANDAKLSFCKSSDDKKLGPAWKDISIPFKDIGLKVYSE